MNPLLLLISLFASIIGAICGIGGGVIIKPAMDIFTNLDVTTISFLSGCTVLMMALYSISRSMIAGESKVNTKLCTPLAIGAAIGGIFGKYLFTIVTSSRFEPSVAGSLQSILLIILTIGTLIYMYFKPHIQTKQISNVALIVIIGLALGTISAFIGIGGGPFNLIALYYFFSIGVKEAAQSSLYIIIFSQSTSLISSIIKGNHIGISIPLIIGMVICGIVGAIIGRKINQHIDEIRVKSLFNQSILLIILISFIHVFRVWN